MKTERLRRMAQQIVEERLYYPVDRLDLGQPLRDIPWFMAWNRNFRVKYILKPGRRVVYRIRLQQREAQGLHELEVEREITRRHAAEDNLRLRIQQDITAGKYSIMGDWVVFNVGQCTCGSPLGPYPHEPYCGVEPVIKLVDAVLPTERELQP